MVASIILNILTITLEMHSLNTIDSTNMNMSNNIHFNALEKISHGISLCASVVRETMGAKGKNVILEEREYPYHQITNDGATIIDRMSFTEPLTKMGHAFLKEVTQRSNNNSGDGSSTTTVLVDAILQEGIKSGLPGMEIKRELDELLPLIEKNIDEQTRQITVDEVEKVATIAGESKELGKILGEIYKFIGKDGIIHLEGSMTSETTYSTIDGVRFFDTGYLTSHMVHDEEAIKEDRKETRAVYENPTILVTRRKISHINDIDPLIRKLQTQNKKDLIIFTDDMDSGVASLLIRAHRERVLNILIIKAPTLWKEFVFEDFAKVVGATIIEDAAGISFKSMEMNHLGTCSRIVVGKDETIILGGQDVSEHIAELKAIGDNDSMRRVSWLTTKTAILRLGANSETELTYKRLKAEDAIHSARTALQSGIVAGGGICLLNAAKELPIVSVGGSIMRRVLFAPAHQIMVNAGLDTPQPTTSNIGIDANTGKEVDMFEAGIVDSAKVVKMAVRNAIGIASTVLTASSMISLPPKTTEEIAAQMLAAQGRPM